MTLPEFSDVFAILAVQLRNTDADETTIRGYYEAMKDLDLELVQMAASRLAKTAEWFPKTGEWRETVAAIESERYVELRGRLRKRTEPLCAACDDTGWARNVETNRVARCDCQALRRLEILGRRPMPALPSGDTA